MKEAFKFNKKIYIALGIIIIALLATYYIFITVSTQRLIVLRIATTTSVDNTGLLNAIKVKFEEKNPGINVTWVAVGTGQAIEISKRGDADLVIVHYRPLENEFIKDGYGIHGITFAWNDFVIVGPSDDPANINSSKDVVEAFKKIYYAGDNGKAFFVSRGDKSGTNFKELEIWNMTGLSVTGKKWYIESGQGMGQTLLMTYEKNAYTLSDRSTFLSISGKLEPKIKILFEGDPILINLYRAILVNPEKFPNIHYSAAEKFVLFLVSNKGQSLIDSYTKNNQKLFNAAFGKLKDLGINDSYEENEILYWSGKLKGS